MSSAPIIKSNRLTREFKDRIAVNELDLSISPGELFGLVGPDGAGKTTTLRLLAGLLDISSGDANIVGFDLGSQPEKIKPQIGYMAQEFNLYSELTVTENLAFFAELYQVDRDEIPVRMEKLLTFAGLTDFNERRAGNLSGGMQKKLALACTLIHDPKVLLLDEPTTGVDPISRREFWNILNDLHVSGTTVVVSTPYMDEADRCSTVGLIHEGQLVICDSPQNIRASIKAEIIELHLSDGHQAIEFIRNQAGVIEVQTYGPSLHILVDSAKKRIPQIKKALSKQKCAISSIRQAPLRMEEAFISLINAMDGQS